MQAVILAAGEGKRMKPVSDILPKVMIPILDKPFLEYVLNEIKEAGINDAVIVVSPKSYEIVRKYFGNGEKLGMKIHYTLQKERRGTAHAIWCAKEFLKDEYFLVRYGDSLTEVNLSAELVKKFEKEGEVDAYLTLRREEETWRYGVIKFDGKKIVDVIEKPDKGKEPSKMVTVGAFILRREEFFKAMENERFEREEFPAKYIINSGGVVRGWVFSGRRVDLGHPKDIINASKLLSFKLFSSNKYIGNIRVGENTVIKNSFVNSSTEIGKNCILENSYIMGNCKIGDNCIVRNSIVCCNLENGEIIENGVAV